jgi:hypothetical protein
MALADGCAPWSIPGPKAVWFDPACIREIQVADICDPVSVQQWLRHGYSTQIQPTDA